MRAIGIGTAMRMMLRRLQASCALAFALICLFCCSSAFAQSTFTVVSASATEPASQLRNQTAANFVAVLPDAPARSAYTEATLLPLHPGDVGFVPLRGDERASLFFKGFLVSPVSYVSMATAAGANWIAGEPEGWHRTFGGYMQRSGTEFLLYTTEEGVHDAGDAALGLDPRYFGCRCSGLWHRSGYALKMTLLAYDGNGYLHLDLPRFAGDYGSSMLVTTWYPANYSPLVQGVKMGHVQVGLDAGMNLLREFTPELKHFFRKLKPAQP